MAVFEGTGANDVYTGGAGNDDIYGGSGNDRLEGGSGMDILLGDDTLADTPDGDDVLFGGDGNDFLAGGLGADQLYGGAGADWMHNGAAKASRSGTSIKIDWPTDEGGPDLMDGGSGDDVALLSFDHETGVLVLDNSDPTLLNVIWRDGVAHGSLTSVERIKIFSGRASDTLTAGPQRMSCTAGAATTSSQATSATTCWTAATAWTPPTLKEPTPSAASRAVRRPSTSASPASRIRAPGASTPSSASKILSGRARATP